MSWIYRNKQVINPPKDKEGFVYLLEYKKVKYIGYKLFCATKKGKVTAKEKKLTGTKKRVKYVKDCEGWRDYCSSNKFFQAITDKENIKKTILHMCSTHALCKYYEVEEIIKRNALASKEYMNGNIQMKCFSNIFDKYLK